MKPKRQSVIQYVLVLLVVLAMQYMASADESYQPYKIESPPQLVAGIDGEWITEIPFYPPDAWGWGIRISGDIGKLTMTNRPNDQKNKVGDVKLIITTKTATAFRGNLICSDGNPYPVTGILLKDGRLGMAQVSGVCHPKNWTMVRKQNVIEVADRNNIGLVKKPLTFNLFIGDGQGNLGTVDIATGSVHVIGNMGHAMTDIAFDPVGNLYGITETDFYSIDRDTGISTWIGSLGVNDANALVFASDGTLYAAGFAGTQLYVVNKSTGQAKAIGNIGPGFRSSGDMAFNGGNLYLSAIGDQLVKIDLTNLYNSRAIGNMGFHDVLGLATGDDGVLYGNAGTQIFSIDTATGAGTFIYDYRGQGLANTNGSTGTPSMESAPLIINQPDENLANASEGWPDLTNPPDVTNSTRQFNTAGSTPPALALSKTAVEIPCSITKTSLKSGLDPSIDPYCHGEFILDHIRVTDADGGGSFDISMNVFVRGEADAALEIYDARGNLVGSTLMPGHRPIPATLYDIFIQNQINVVRGLTDEYPWNDDRDSRQSQMTRDVRIHVPAGGRFELTKSSVRAITYNEIRMAIELISEAGLDSKNIRNHRFNDIVINMGTEAADLFRKTALSGDKPDVSAATKIVASIATVFLDPANLDGRHVFQRSLKKAMGDNVFAGISGVALEGKVFNTLNALWDLYNAGRNTDQAVYWRAPLIVPDASSLTNSNAKEDARTLCNKSPSVSSLSIGGAQGALKKFGSGTDGCSK